MKSKPTKTEAAFDAAERRLKRMLKNYGDRCPDFNPLCAQCQGWRLFDETGNYPRQKDVSRECEKHQPVNLILARRDCGPEEFQIGEPAENE
jgi:hypothetical protein